ncbi:hypothetical protein EVAR_88221_1 [Eumeta japonica]|uniref:Uncharacterized protein n=1 Tax=Eumeta variegata TaxID=151549 RepID=A0A4C1Z1R7_EUMVA|nr:hypothetical protein EVAR_88221_1 [Eumeta japonica]
MADSRKIGWSQPIQRGKPARGEKTNTRSQRRAYEFQHNKAYEQDWTEGRPFEDRPAKPRGRTQRSANWLEKKNSSKPVKEEAKTDPATSYDFRVKDETAPVDEPLYDLGPHTSSIPVQEIYS